MLALIGYHLARLARFSGRERIGRFWPWVAALMVLLALASAAVLVPMMLETMARMQRFAAEHPELTTVEQGPGHYSIEIQGYHPELFPDLTNAVIGMAGLVAIFVLLVAAAVVRRLHDRGRRGIWALPPLLFLAMGMALFPSLMRSFAGPAPDLGLFGLLFANNVAYLATLALLIVQLAGRGSDGPNRYGPEDRD